MLTEQRAMQQIFDEQFHDRIRFAFQTRLTSFYSVVLTLLDEDNQVLNLDSSTYATALIINESDTVYANFSTQNQSSSLTKTTVQGSFRVPCKAGVYIFSSFDVAGNLSSKAILAFQSEAIKGTTYFETQDSITKRSSDHIVYQGKYTIRLPSIIRTCTHGQIFSHLLQQCVDCSTQTYAFENKTTQCLPCPNQASCAGGASIVVNPGYWRFSPYSDQIYPCPHSGACKGGLIGECETGYKGILCSRCTSVDGVRYSSSGDGRCTRCANTLVSVIVITAIGCVLFVLLWLMVKATFQSAQLQTSTIRQKVVSIMEKIFLNYIQTVTLICSLPILSLIHI
eukprot:TRINITY_DN808_c0_g6_i1.p1 TRINITY_DN808_c0_g6~~TRINITY_DN808_c0_g6_i1.p1  ORF type:complete len:339 (-),score=-2.08 TRINITY_DN808_c0_g6_i1:4-1020(-)